MMIFSKDKIAKTAQEIADTLQLVEHVKSLQQGQKEIVDAMAKLSDRMRDMEYSLKAIKAETLHEAAKETQQVLNSVQGGFYDRITRLTIQADRVEREVASLKVSPEPQPKIAISKTSSDERSQIDGPGH